MIVTYIDYHSIICTFQVNMIYPDNQKPWLQLPICQDCYFSDIMWPLEIPPFELDKPVFWMLLEVQTKLYKVKIWYKNSYTSSLIKSNILHVTANVNSCVAYTIAAMKITAHAIFFNLDVLGFTIYPSTWILVPLAKSCRISSIPIMDIETFS